MKTITTRHEEIKRNRATAERNKWMRIAEAMAEQAARYHKQGNVVLRDQVIRQTDDLQFGADRYAAKLLGAMNTTTTRSWHAVGETHDEDRCDAKLNAARAAAKSAFDKYLGTATAAMHVPDCVVEAARAAYAAAGGDPDRILVRGHGNPTHPVCSITVEVESR